MNRRPHMWLNCVSSVSTPRDFSRDLEYSAVVTWQNWTVVNTCQIDNEKLFSITNMTLQHIVAIRFIFISSVLLTSTFKMFYINASKIQFNKKRLNFRAGNWKYQWNWAKLLFIGLHCSETKYNTAATHADYHNEKIVSVVFFPSFTSFFHFLFPSSPPPWSGPIKSSEGIWFRSRQTRSMGSKYAKRSFGVSLTESSGNVSAANVVLILLNIKSKKRSLDL